MGGARAITTDNGIALCTGVTKLCDRINIQSNQARLLGDFHARSVAHIVNLAFKECLALFHGEIATIISFINSLRSSVMRRDLCQKVRCELAAHHHLP